MHKTKNILKEEKSFINFDHDRLPKMKTPFYIEHEHSPPAEMRMSLVH
jgi:hypothetical protein